MFGGGGFFGGGADQSSSAQTSTNTTQTSNVSGGASEGAWNLSAHGDVMLSDPGVLKLGDNILNLGGGVLDLAASIFDKGISSIRQSSAENVGLAANALQKVTLDSGERVQSIVTVVAIAAGVALVGYALVKKFS